MKKTPLKRVNILYEHRVVNRNDGAPLYWSNLLKDKEKYPGIEAHHLVPDGKYGIYTKPDLYIWPDFGEDGFLDAIPYPLDWPTDAPIAYFASDTHLGKDYRFKMAEKADYVFFAQKPGYEEYMKSKLDFPVNKHVQWLPHGVDSRAFPDTPKAPKKWDVSFVGHLVSEERIDFLDAIFKEFPNFFFGQRLSRYVNDQGREDDCGDIYRKTKIVLNPPTKNDLNMRHFEVAATGTFQITAEVPGLYDIFKEGESIVTYKDIPDAIEKIQYYLEHEKERESIAKKAHDIVLKSHTYEDRLNVMLKVAGII